MKAIKLTLVSLAIFGNLLLPFGVAEAKTKPRQVPTGVTAICRDGTYSYSQHRRGTCSHHKGVSQWLLNVPK